MPRRQATANTDFVTSIPDQGHLPDRQASQRLHATLPQPAGGSVAAVARVGAENGNSQVNPGLPDGMYTYFHTKIPILKYFEGPLIGKCWYMLWPFGIFYRNLVYFPFASVYCTNKDKSGNPG
jgi:hypothetical protein